MIRYSSGELMLVSPDLSSDGFGQSWGHTRSYSNRLTANPGNLGVNGAGWFIKESPQLVNTSPIPGHPNHGTIVVLGVVSEAVWFDYVSATNSFQARFFVLDTLVHKGGEFIFTDSDGRQTLFYDFNAKPAALRGRFKGFINPYGQLTLAAYNSNNQISSYAQEEIPAGSSSSGSAGKTTAYGYNYYTGGENAGRLKLVTQMRGTVGVRSAHFTYYGSGTPHGSLGDLQLVKLQQHNGSAWEALGTTHYRYYQSGDPKGFVHGLKYIVSPATYSQMVAAGIMPENAPDSQIARLADVYLEYDGSQRVSRVRLAGVYDYRYEYTASANPDGYNNWKMKTVETLPDGNRNIIYTNYAGQVILKVFQAGASQWYEYYKFDDNGRCILAAKSSAVASYAESSPGLVTLKTNAGLIYIYDFYTTSGGGAAPGYLQDEKVQQGANGNPIRTREWQYVRRKQGGNTVYPLSKETLYQNNGGGGSNPAVTKYAYTWYGTTLQMQQRTTIPPVIPMSQNGDGTTYNRHDYFDAYGRVTWQMDELGFLTRTMYDDPSGAVIQVIRDVNTSVIAGAPPGWVTPTGGGLNLITDYTVDNLGRVTQELGPLHDVDIGGTSTTIRRAAWTVYQDTIGQQWSGSGYWNQSDSSYTLINPVQITRSNGFGQAIDRIAAVRSTTDGPLTAADTFPQSSWVRWQRNNYSGVLLNEQVYFSIPASGKGTRGINYNQTDYLYNVMRRRVRMEAPGGTITRYVLSSQGWLLETWVGTDDTGATNNRPDGGGGPRANNMKRVEARQYDKGQDKGNGNLTRLTQYLDNYTHRVTNYGYDFRNRQTSVDGEIDFYQTQTYDNQDRVTQMDRRNTKASGNLVARSAVRYDRQGRVYQTVTYAVDPSTGTVGNALTSNTWRDAVGNLIRQQPAGSNAFTKSFYDGVRRLTMQYTGYAISSPAGDIVMQQTENTYDDAGNVIEQLVRERFHDAPATAVGLLTDPSGSDPKARVSYMAMWPDPLGRVIATANYGTNGGSPLSRPDTIPASSSTVLLSTIAYNNRGEAYLVTDPAGTATQSVFDDTGRLVEKVEDYSTSPGHLNRQTDYEYNADGKLTSLIARNSTTGDQVTTYTYGVKLGPSNIASNELLAAITYPDSIGSSDRVTFTYNRQGEVKTRTDQLGTVHTLEYDLLGRVIHDRVTNLGAGVDGAIRRISTTYEVRGMVQNVTSYDNATVGSGSVVNDLLHVYNSFSQLVNEYQSHAGAVNTASTPQTQYGYADGSTNTVRPSSITYPNGRVITFSYGTAAAMNDQLSRIQSLVDNDTGSTHLADYAYVGLGRTVQVNSPQPGTALTYIKQGSELIGDGGDQYTGWDRFTRVIDQRWILVATGAALERIQYGFDEASNRLYRANLVASGGQDEYYTYDTLYQLLALQRGTLNSTRTGITGTPGREEDFTFDPTGNWNNYVTKASGIMTLNQGRTHNKVNEITAINGSSAYIAENAVGNTVTAPRTDNWLAVNYLAYDAWNRLVSVSGIPSSSSSSSSSSKGSSGSAGSSSGSPGTSGSPAATVVATYQYDGLNRRVSKTTSTVRHYFYTTQWQVIEERVGSATSADRQFVWGLRYLDDLVLRDMGTQRLYALHDYFNCTAVVNASGAVQERYGYDAFGKSRVMDATFNPRTVSLYDWETRYADYRFDSETGYYQVRNRYLHPTLGRWLTRDIIEYQSGINLYAYTSNRPISSIDPTGLESFDIWVSAFIPDVTFHFPYDGYLDATWHGDGRTNAMLNGSSRAWNHFRIETDPKKPATVFNISGGGTTIVDYGFFFQNQAADTAPPLVTVSRSADNKVTTATVFCETKDPLIIIQPLTPALHYAYTWVFNTTNGTLCITGSTKQYPGYDMIINGKVPYLKVPPVGTSPLKLLKSPTNISPITIPIKKY